MKKILVLLLILTLLGCTEVNEANNTDMAEQTTDLEQTVEVDSQVENKWYSFSDKEEAVSILAAEDDYTSKLSVFDFASKYNSDQPLSVDERKVIYDQLVLDWSDEEKKVIDQAMVTIQKHLEKLEIQVPDIRFILTSPEDEGGAAYTRNNAIILKPRHAKVHSKGLEDLIAHEFFHVYSRLNKDKRVAMYKVIGYEPCQELVIPEVIKDLMISNPDAPDNNFYITLDYKDMPMQFVPIIYSSEPYVIDSGTSFFRTLRDDLLAVEVVDGVAKPLYEAGQPLIVSKDDVKGFYETIGRNTTYTYHPEETMADNFVFLLFGRSVTDQWVIDGLREALEE